MKHLSSRRNFLLKTASVSAVAPSLSRVLGANERINLGLIGAGKRGFSLLNRMRTQKAHPVFFKAVCDVYPAYLQRARKATGNMADGYEDYRALLARGDIQAVVIASPEHWHRTHLVDAIKAGKHAYVETPLSHTVEEAEEMVQVVQQSKQIVQVGIQERSAPHFESARREILDKKAPPLGTITQVSAWWRMRWPEALNDKKPEKLSWGLFLGQETASAPPGRFWEWPFYPETGGGILTLRGSHVCDWIHWFMEVERPTSAAMSGGKYVIHRWDVPDTFTAVWEYPNWTAEFSVSCGSSFTDWHDHGVCFRGTDGALEISRRGWRRYSALEKQIVKEIPGSDMDGAHVANFLACIAGSGATPNAPVEVGRNAACAAHCAYEAFREERKLTIGDGWKRWPADEAEPATTPPTEKKAEKQEKAAEKTS